MKKIALITAATCMTISTATLAAPPGKKQVGAAIQAAVKSIESANAVRGEWRDSYKILGKAKKAYRKGDMAGAMKLAHKAKRQGELGKAQALAEKKYQSMPASVR